MGTTCNTSALSIGKLFQSTCPRWARPVVPLPMNGSRTFQSTCPRWARPIPTQPKPKRTKISIHVPAMGTTSSICTRADNPCNFNPRARDGHDGRDRADKPNEIRFQSTCPRWARLSKRRNGRRAREAFQSTCPRWARRGPPIPLSGQVQISIHVPAMGTTSYRETGTHHRHDFNPRARDGHDKKSAGV